MNTPEPDYKALLEQANMAPIYDKDINKWLLIETSCLRDALQNACDAKHHLRQQLRKEREQNVNLKDQMYELSSKHDVWKTYAIVFMLMFILSTALAIFVALKGNH